MPQCDAACGEAGSERSQQRTRRQAGVARSLQHEQHGRRRHIAAVGDHLPLMVERALMQGQRSFQRVDDLGAAGMADKAIDLGRGQPHVRENSASPPD